MIQFRACSMKKSASLSQDTLSARTSRGELMYLMNLTTHCVEFYSKEPVILNVDLSEEQRWELFNHFRISKPLGIDQSLQGVWAKVLPTGTVFVCLEAGATAAIWSEWGSDCRVVGPGPGQPPAWGLQAFHPFLRHPPRPLGAGPTLRPAPGLRLAFCLLPDTYVSGTVPQWTRRPWTHGSLQPSGGYPALNNCTSNCGQYLLRRGNKLLWERFTARGGGSQGNQRQGGTKGGFQLFVRPIT